MDIVVKNDVRNHISIPIEIVSITEDVVCNKDVVKMDTKKEVLKANEAKVVDSEAKGIYLIGMEVLLDVEIIILGHFADVQKNIPLDLADKIPVIDCMGKIVVPDFTS